MQRRLLIAIGASLALGAFALVPTEKLQPSPSKPLFFYLVPLLRVQELLVEAEKIIPGGDYEQLRRVLERIQGPPNNVQDNLRKAAACKYGSKKVVFSSFLSLYYYSSLFDNVFSSSPRFFFMIFLFCSFIGFSCSHCSR